MKSIFWSKILIASFVLLTDGLFAFETEQRKGEFSATGNIDHPISQWILTDAPDNDTQSLYTAKLTLAATDYSEQTGLNLHKHTFISLSKHSPANPRAPPITA